MTAPDNLEEIQADIYKEIEEKRRAEREAHACHPSLCALANKEYRLPAEKKPVPTPMAARHWLPSPREYFYAGFTLTIAMAAAAYVLLDYLTK